MKKIIVVLVLILLIDMVFITEKPKSEGQVITSCGTFTYSPEDGMYVIRLIPKGEGEGFVCSWQGSPTLAEKKIKSIIKKYNCKTK